jgi:signal transduction histidine kinase
VKTPLSHVPFPTFPIHLEQEFWRHYNEISASVAWGALLLGEGIYLVFYLWDLLIDYDHAGGTLIVRLLVAAWVMVVLLLPASLRVKYLQTLYSATAAIAGVGAAVILALLRDGLILGLAGVLLVLMFNFGFLRLLFLPSLASGAIICAAYNIAAIVSELKPSQMVANNFFLIAAAFAGASVTYLLERLFRTQFLTDKELAHEREALARQHQADVRYLAWLRQLAAFLRHEVRQPVAQINSSIEVVQLSCDIDERLKPYLASAALSTQHVWNLIERASLATDAEAFVRQYNPRSMDLHRLVSEVTDGFQQTYSGIKLEIQRVVPIFIQADPILVKEAIDNLLSNATSFAYDGSTIEIELTNEDAYAVVKVRNKGPSLIGDTEMLFGPFASTRSGPSSEHHGLGLYLVRLIAEQHGGTANIANTRDGRGVEASILLPL